VDTGPGRCVDGTGGQGRGFPHILYDAREPCTPVHIDAYGRQGLPVLEKNAYTNVSVQTATTQPKGRGSHIVDCFTVLCPAHELVDHVQWSKVRAVGRLHIVSN
jgi:hypothetical protein